MTMARRKLHLVIRRLHRYFGVVIGIQFLLWTIGGLYFSWSDIDEIHGNSHRRQPALLPAGTAMISPTVALEGNGIVADSFHSMQMVNILQRPYFHVKYYGGRQLRSVLLDAVSGKLKNGVTKVEAIRIAEESFSEPASIQSVEYVHSVSSHSEYREKLLPAWKVRFDHPGNTNVYISTEVGKVESFRNNKWRIFDFLWMFHTMDYDGRDNINNWVLRVFSVLGLITILSGFTLFFFSPGIIRKRRHHKQE